MTQFPCFIGQEMAVSEMWVEIQTWECDLYKTPPHQGGGCGSEVGLEVASNYRDGFSPPHKTSPPGSEHIGAFSAGCSCPG